MSQHPCDPAVLRATLDRAVGGDMPEGLSELQTSARVGQTWRVAISEHLVVRAHFEIDGLAFGYPGEGGRQFASEIRTGGLWPELEVRECTDGVRRPGQGANLFEYDKIELFIPEWIEHLGEGPVDDTALTRRLAFDGDASEYLFPGDHRAEDGAVHEQVEALNTRSALAAGWLLGRLDNGRLQIDLSRARVAAGDNVYDGHGTPLAFGARMTSRLTQQVFDTIGEDAFREALSQGYLHGNGGAAMKGASFRPDRIDRICDVLAGRSEKTVNLTFGVSWEERAFETVVRPHVPDVAFPVSPPDIDGKPYHLALLQARLAGPAPETFEEEPS